MSDTYVIFSANYLPNTGGVEKYTHNLAHALSKQGSRVIVVTNNVFNLLPRENEGELVEVIRLPCRKVMKGRYPLPLQNREFIKQIDYLQNQQVDHVIVNTRFYFHSLLGVKFAKTKGIKPLVIDHGSAHLTVGSKFFDAPIATYEHIFTSFLKRYPADYYAVSEASVQWLTHFGIKARGTLCNSIDAELFRTKASNRDFRKECRIDTQDFLVAYTGRFVPEKGIGALLDTAEALKEHLDIHFLLAGEGPLESVIKQQKLPNIHLLGKLDESDVAALLSQANTLCLPTRSEGFSTTLLEAAACGTTPIITRVGGVDELMPTADYGIILNEINGNEIAKSILKLHDDRVLNKQLGDCIQHHVECNFSWQATAQHAREACQRAYQQSR